MNNSFVVLGSKRLIYCCRLLTRWEKKKNVHLSTFPIRTHSLTTLSCPSPSPFAHFMFKMNRFGRQPFSLAKKLHVRASVQQGLSTSSSSTSYEATRSLLVGSSSSRTHNHGNQGNVWSWAAAAAAVAAVTGVTVLSHRSESCGIVGVVGGDDAVGFLLEGLTILRNRGYDSAGIASIAPDGTSMVVTKYASRESTSDSIDLVRAHAGEHVGHSIGIGHTRWATHGGKTDQNAHPHIDAKARVAVIHNGTIHNSKPTSIFTYLVFTFPSTPHHRND